MCKEIKPVHLKGDQSWVFFGRTDAEAPILWPHHAKSWLIGKDSDAGKDWRQKRRGRQRIRCLDSITDSVDMNPGKLWEIVKDREAWHASVHGVSKHWTWLSDWAIATMGCGLQLAFHVCLSGLLGINNIILVHSVPSILSLLNYLSASRKLISWPQESECLVSTRHHCMGDGLGQGMEMEWGR